MSDKISNSTTSDGKPLPEKAARSRVAMATLAGTTLEWYDFFLYGTAAALIFNKQFFPRPEPHGRHAGCLQHLRRRVHCTAGGWTRVRALR